MNYISGLHDHFSRLAKRDLRWKQLPADRLDGATVYISRYEKHYVIFKEISAGIGVITVLHSAMDISERLAEDLRSLADN